MLRRTFCKAFLSNSEKLVRYGDGEYCISRYRYRDARRIMIECILHTDNAHHFEMIKTLQMLYQLNREVGECCLSQCTSVLNSVIVTNEKMLLLR